jgi:hypothetical protein
VCHVRSSKSKGHQRFQNTIIFGLHESKRLLDIGERETMGSHCAGHLLQKRLILPTRRPHVTTLSMNALLFLLCCVSATPNPLTARETTLDAGEVKAGPLLARTFTLTNTGTAALTVTSLESTGRRRIGRSAH